MRPAAGARHRRLDPIHSIHLPSGQALAHIIQILGVGLNHTPSTRTIDQRPEHRAFAMRANASIAAGERPCIQVVVVGFNGLRVRLVVTGLPGAIGHARTRRRAREIARTSVASILHLDPYAFDLTVDGA